MLQISQLKLKVTHTTEELEQKIRKTLQISEKELESYEIQKQSLDARHKPELYYVYTIMAKVSNEKAVFSKLQKKRQDKNIECCHQKKYVFPEMGMERLSHRPVIVGCGPAGLFCAYFLARYGYRPILIERGAPVEERRSDVEAFWKTGVLRPDSNVQFGEGGAGTFSDGKLNTLVKDPENRIHEVLKVFTKFGAPKDILYVNKPHIGTDILCDVIRNMRMEIVKSGGEILFHTKAEALILDPSNQKLKGIHLVDLQGQEKAWDLDTDVLVLAPGHSARDTFAMLERMGIPMEAKSFAVGVRVEHPQELINQSQYGEGHSDHLPAAAYKLTAKLPDGRGVYTFCMCPGGYVVNASSEEGMLAVNGMSYHARDSKNANSAVIVTVNPEDFEAEGPLAGITFQRKLEKAAYEAGMGKIPVQRYGAFYQEVMGSTKEGETDAVWEPCMKGAYTYTSLTQIFPACLNRSLISGMEEFNRKIPGYASPNALLSAVESRTSSPIRILRDQTMQSTIRGLYPCGEGAGYAGGITSAAVDGMKIAETIRKKYQPFDI